MVKEKKVKAVKVPKVKVPKEKKVRVDKNSTPQELIDMMNAEHQEWKTTKQVKYDKEGKRLD
jgi:hypothetical protein